MSMHQIVIEDGEGLRSVLEVVLKHAGTHAKAAEFLGIGQTTFTRLLNGVTRKSMAFTTYESIRGALDGHALEFGLIDHFEASILSWESDQVRHRYEEWVREELERLGPKVESLFFRLFESSTYQPYFKRFLEHVRYRAELPPESDRRAWLALYRSVESLQDSEATWGVERGLEELESAEDLGSYLRHSLACERIMLDRARDLARIRSLAPPEKWMADFVEDREPTEEEVAAEKEMWALRAQRRDETG